MTAVPTEPTSQLPFENAHATPSSARLESLDLFRGVAILAVVGIHVSGHALRIPGLQPGALAALETLNRLLQFAVPGFLFMTALVFAYQYRAKPLEPRTFYAKRLRGVVQPYLVWTALYAVFTVVAGSLTYRALLEPNRWLNWIFTGKAFYHLYFMVIVIQFYVLFPLLMPLFRGRSRFTGRSSLLTLAGIAAFALAFYWLNRLYFRIPNIGSVVFWHTVPLGLGMWIGASLPDWPRLWTRARAPMTVLLLLSSVWYLPLALAAVRGQAVNTFAAAVSGWLFSGMVALVLLGLCTALERWVGSAAEGKKQKAGGSNGARARPWFYSGLLLLGTFSLQIYLMHPAVIKALEWAGRHGLGFFERLSGHVLMYALCVALPLAFAYLIRGIRLSSALFGR